MFGEQEKPVSNVKGSVDEALARTLASTEVGAPTLTEGWASETILSDAGGAAEADLAGAPSLQGGRTTVLPRVKMRGAAPKLVVEDRARYEEIQELGSGGVGMVALVRDNDIDRLVALKRLKPEQRQAAGTLVRFAEEVRTIGQLEHPNIVPVHDVGVDANGEYFFVMKYVEGQTLEQVIQRLREGDPATHARFTFEYRTQVFMEVLRAIQYAHERGVIHRDIKPANIMVGPWGEVTVMDWGLAKRLGELKSTLEGAPPEPAEAFEGRPEAEGQSEAQRMFETQYGALLGTPAYMAPEQALGQTDEIGEGSDIYSLTVTFHEFLTLRHYLSHKKNVAGMLTGVMDEALPSLSEAAHPHQGKPPGELDWFLGRGASKDPRQRWGSVAEMITALQMVVEGRVSVHCPVTFTRRMNREMNLMVRRSPLLMAAGYVTMGLLSLFGLASLTFMVFSGIF